MVFIIHALPIQEIQEVLFSMYLVAEVAEGLGIQIQALQQILGVAGRQELQVVVLVAKLEVLLLLEILGLRHLRQLQERGEAVAAAGHQIYTTVIIVFCRLEVAVGAQEEARATQAIAATQDLLLRQQHLTVYR